MREGFQGTSAPGGKTNWEVAQRVQQGQQQMNLQGPSTLRNILQHLGNISFCWAVNAYPLPPPLKKKKNKTKTFSFSSLPQKKAAVVPQALGALAEAWHILSSDPDEVFLQASHHCKCCF